MRSPIEECSPGLRHNVSEPTQIIEEGDSAVTVVWDDGLESTFNARDLRIACPCASCIDEWTGAKRLDESRVPEAITFSGISIVGRYALNFRFSDGHDTGIFSFALLRKIADSSTK